MILVSRNIKYICTIYSWFPRRRIYGRPVGGHVTRANEQQALCTDVYSNVDQRGSGGRVAFSTLEGRPSALQFDTSPVLQVQFVYNFISARHDLI